MEKLGPERFSLSDGGMLVEIRSTGGQTVFPPSTHPTGESVSWDHHGNPARVTATELLVAVQRLASATAFALNWPAKGSRHDTALALAGALLSRGCEPHRVEGFIRLVASAAGDDQVEDRVATVGATQRSLESGQSVTGLRRLAEIVGDEPVKVATKWLGLTARKEPLNNKTCTDAANGERLVRAFGDDIRFDE